VSAVERIGKADIANVESADVANQRREKLLVPDIVLLLV
jgi:hypothetical protein